MKNMYPLSQMTTKQFKYQATAERISKKTLPKLDLFSVPTHISSYFYAISLDSVFFFNPIVCILTLSWAHPFLPLDHFFSYPLFPSSFHILPYLHDFTGHCNRLRSSHLPMHHNPGKIAPTQAEWTHCLMGIRYLYHVKCGGRPQCPTSASPHYAE